MHSRLPRQAITALVRFVARYNLHQRGAVPVPISAVAEYEGFRIYYAPRLWPLNGYAITLGPLRVMEINSDLSLPYQRWTIAHELAHTILHDPSALNLCTAGNRSFTRWVRQRIERQADIAAAYIHIPDWVIAETGGAISDIAVICEVPEELVMIRLDIC
jgi:hypothetical protein